MLNNLTLTSPGSPANARPGLSLAVGPGDPVQLRLLRPVALVAAGRAAVASALASSGGTAALNQLATQEPFQ